MVNPSARESDTEVQRDVNGFWPACYRHELEGKGFKLVLGPPGEVGLIKIADRTYAVKNYCPHRGAPICRGFVGPSLVIGADGAVGASSGNVLMCPWHRWEFDLSTGASIGNIDRRRLIVYEVRDVDGRIFVSDRPARRADMR